MFKSARFKITFLFVFISILISGFFSFMIYSRSVRDFEEAFLRAEIRARFRHLPIRIREFLDRRTLSPAMRSLIAEVLASEELKKVKKRLMLDLLFLNVFILFLSGIFGYFLSGKILKPIEMALEDQKRFISDASHELRTPLTALRTLLEISLRDKRKTSKGYKEVLKEALKEIEDMQEFSNRLLDLSYYQELQNGLKFQKLNLEKIFSEVYEKIKPLAELKKLSLKTNFKEKFIFADEEAFKKLLAVLLDNAVKYNKEKGLIEVSSQRKNKFVEIKISDTGIGIDKEDIPHIFDRFYRAEKSRSKEEYKGYGLGLSLAKRIIELHNGKILVKSKPGEGSTFIILLPYH